MKCCNVECRTPFCPRCGRPVQQPAPPPGPPHAGFGAWLMTAAGLDHYFLGGKTLCGAALAAGQKRPDTSSNNVDLRHRCPACHKLNLERWAGT